MFGPAPLELTPEILRAVMPHLKEPRFSAVLPELRRAMLEAEITAPLRVAAFLAQLAHESGQLRYMEEIASGAAYEGRLDLGNTQPGDGVRFKGRGPIQLTGRTNYARAGKALGLDLVKHPERAADFDVGFRVAAWYWRHGKAVDLNKLADKGPAAFDRITRAINGGLNGKADRDRYYAAARKAIGC